MLTLDLPPPGAPPPAVVTLAFRPPAQAGDETAYLAALDRVGEIATPFGLLVVLGAGLALSRDGERAQAMWFKATRQTLEARCLAMAVVRPVVTPRMVETFGRLWSMPLHFTTDEADAARWLRARLAGGAQ